MKMNEMIKSFPDQIIDQFENLSSLQLTQDKFSKVNNIVVAGMGGSAISGDLIKLFLKNEIDIPITVIRDYAIPNWTNENTLFILSSYSGNTEETLSCFSLAVLKSKKVISITTGGSLENESLKNEVPVVKIPKGFQPRAALGFSLISLLCVFNKINLLNSDFIDKIIDATKSLYQYMDEFCEEGGLAESIAKDINNSIIAIYGVENSTDHIASRLRAQIAENSKMLTSFNVIPEMNHNEIEGWNTFQFKNLNKIAIWIYDEEDNPRILDRIKITSTLLEEVGVNNILIKSSGKNYQERCLKLIFLNDWISYYLALENNIDPIPVNRIMDLKSKLS